MSESPTNADRTEWARMTVEYFQGLVHNTGEPAEENVSDLLADLMHYCDEENVNFQQCLERGTGHYEEEKAEEEDADECEQCGDPIEPGEGESTYCGSMHESCRADHNETCEVCRADSE